MNKIEQMIKDLCPDGVKWVKLEEVCEIKNGKDYKQLGIGEIPVWGTGGVMAYVDKYAYDKPSVLLPRKGSIDVVYYTDKPFWTIDTLFYTIINTELIAPKFLYEYMTLVDLVSLDTSKGNRPSLTQTVLNKILIPLPPLAIQEQIVTILDKFESMITNLETELASRQKQYEYYRNKLLTFDEGDESVEWKTLGEACNISRGKRVVRKDLAEFGNIPVYQNSLKPLGYADDSNYPANTPFIISAGAAGEVGFSFTEYWGADDCFSILCNERINSRYTYHWLKIKEDFLQSRIRGGAIKRLSRDDVENLLIPIPVLGRQQEIVSTLDTFESLISNIKQELEARKKQYEYYREKLLTFE